jgi:putative transposase
MKGDLLSITVDSGVSDRSGIEVSDAGSGVVLEDAGRLLGELLSPEELDVIMDRVRGQNLRLVGEGGVLSLLSKTILERALEEERTEHLGYERGDPAGRGSGNSRNGTTPKRVFTDVGPVDLDVPRDRAGTFEPAIVPVGVTRLGGFSDTIVAWYATGMSTRDIRRQIRRMYGADISAELVSRVTDGVVDELKDWQTRPLDRVYPIVYIDALVVKVRTNGTVGNRPAYLAVGVDVEGRKHILGVWLGDGGEGAKFWLTVLSDIKARGVTDVIFVCCDGLKGLPDAIEATWPKATVQTCVVHLVRASLRYCSWKDRKTVAGALRKIYTAPSVEAAADALDDFELEYGERYPGIVRVWRDAWEQFTPFLAYPPVIRKIVYTTNMIESTNYQMRKASKTRGHFPNDESALKLLRLIAMNITTTRGGEAGTATPGWKQALNMFDKYFPARLYP